MLSIGSQIQPYFTSLAPKHTMEINEKQYFLHLMLSIWEGQGEKANKRGTKFCHNRMITVDQLLE